MNCLLRPVFAAAALATFLYASGAYANAIVTADPQVPWSVIPGNPVSVSMTVSDDGANTPAFNMSSIWTWDFRLRWNYAVLGDLLPTSTMTVNGTTRTLPDLVTYLNGLDLDGDSLTDNGVRHDGKEGTYDGTYYLEWVNSVFALSGLAFGTGYTFTAQFQPIASGDAVINFDSEDRTLLSSLGDDSFFSPLSYGDVTTGPQMKVTVSPQPAPEPGILGLLIGGFAAYLGAAGLRRRAFS